MLHVTPEARQWLQGLLEEALSDHPRIDAVPELAFRIVHDESESTSDLGLVLDEPRASDDVVEHEERPVLVVDAAVSELLSGLTLDVQATDAGEQLALREEPRPRDPAEPDPEAGEPPGAAGAAS